MSDEPETTDPERRALAFERMAKLIRRNADAKFGGAFLIVPPGDGETFASLMLDQDEAAIFWASLKTLAQMGVEAAEKAARQGMGFGR